MPEITEFKMPSVFAELRADMDPDLESDLVNGRITEWQAHIVSIKRRLNRLEAQFTECQLYGNHVVGEIISNAGTYSCARCGGIYTLIGHEPKVGRESDG